MIPEANFFSFLKQRRGLLDGVVISWGEPTLQRDIASFCRRVKELGFLVKLDTNGRDPVLLKKLIEEELVDYIAMDIKANLAQRHTLLQTKETTSPYLQSIKILLSNPCPYEFRTTLIRGVHTKENVGELLSLIEWAERYYVQTYRPEITLDPNFEGKAFSEVEMEEFAEMGREVVGECWVR